MVDRVVAQMQLATVFQTQLARITALQIPQTHKIKPQFKKSPWLTSGDFFITSNVY